MKTKTKETTVETWLPVFSGFYETIWETDGDEEVEIENINELRASKGLAPITWDDIEWNYSEYQQSVAKGITAHVGEELKKLGMIDGYKMQKLVSPREYNFRNDSIDVVFQLTDENKTNIGNYLDNHREAFQKYLTGRYTSYSGFISSYSTVLRHWTDVLEETLTHGHKLGSVLNFILQNEDNEIEGTIHECLHSNGAVLQASNYDKLLGVQS